MSLLIIASDCSAEEADQHAPSHDALYEGFLDLGNPLNPSGEAWHDDSFGPTYGDGRRYEREESYGMTKVASRHTGTKRGHS